MKQLTEKQILKIYNKYLKNIYKDLGKGETDSNQLNQYAASLFGDKFAGVYASDQVPNLSKKSPYCIVNLDPSNKPGEHWVAVYLQNNDTVLLYDSFGRDANTLLKAFSKYFKKLGKKIINSDRDAEQLIIQDDCGQRCLSFLLCVQNYGYRNATLI